MVAARLSAILLIALATTLAAQTPSTNQLAVTITDTTGAVVPGARISIIRLTDAIPPDSEWRSYALRESAKVTAVSDSAGGRTFSLAAGSYAIAINADGFRRDTKKIEVGEDLNQPITVAFVLQMEDQDYFGFGGPDIPVEAEFLDISIPFQPLQTIRPASTRVRKHRS